MDNYREIFSKFLGNKLPKKIVSESELVRLCKDYILAKGVFSVSTGQECVNELSSLASSRYTVIQHFATYRMERDTELQVVHGNSELEVIVEVLKNIAKPKILVPKISTKSSGIRKPKGEHKHTPFIQQSILKDYIKIIRKSPKKKKMEVYNELGEKYKKSPTTICAIIKKLTKGK
jgi:hypothetical protein